MNDQELAARYADALASTLDTIDDEALLDIVRDNDSGTWTYVLTVGGPYAAVALDPFQRDMVHVFVAWGTARERRLVDHPACAALLREIVSSLV